MRSDNHPARVTIAVVYGVVACALGAAGWLLWSQWTHLRSDMASSPPLTPAATAVRIVPSTVIEADPEVVVLTTPTRPTSDRPHHVRGGIMIVGRRGVTHAVAPPTPGDLTASSARSFGSAAAQGTGDTPAASGPRIFTSDRASAAGGDYRRWDLRFYNYDANPTEVIRRLNKGLANDPNWAPRPR